MALMAMQAGDATGQKRKRRDRKRKLNLFDLKTGWIKIGWISSRNKRGVEVVQFFKCFGYSYRHSVRARIEKQRAMLDEVIKDCQKN